MAESATMRAARLSAQINDRRGNTPVAVQALLAIVERSNNGDLGTSKVNDMRMIAISALRELGLYNG